MSGIVTTEKYIVKMKGIERQFPLFNTRSFFINRLCFAIKRNGRILYYPCSATRSAETYPYTIGFKRNNIIYYFCSTYKDSLTNCSINVSWYRTWRYWGFYKYEKYNITITASGGQLEGFSFSYRIQLSGDHYFYDSDNNRITDFSLAPGDSKYVWIEYDSSIIVEPYPSLQIIAYCDIASNTNKIVSADMLGRDGNLALNFDLNE